MARIRANRPGSSWVPWEGEKQGSVAASAAKAKLEQRRAQAASVNWRKHQWVHVRRTLSDEKGFFARLLTIKETDHFGSQYTVYLPVAMHGDCRTTIMVDQELIRPLEPMDFLNGRNLVSLKRNGRTPTAHAHFEENAYRVLRLFLEPDTQVTQAEMQEACGTFPVIEVVDALQEGGYIEPEVDETGEITKGVFFLAKHPHVGRYVKELAARFKGIGEPQRLSAGNASPRNNGERKAPTGSKRSQGTTPEPASVTNGRAPASSKVTRTTAARPATRTETAGRQTPTSKAGHVGGTSKAKGSAKRPSTTTSPEAAPAMAERTQKAGARVAQSETSDERESLDND